MKNLFVILKGGHTNRSTSSSSAISSSVEEIWYWRVLVDGEMFELPHTDRPIISAICKPLTVAIGSIDIPGQKVLALFRNISPFVIPILSVIRRIGKRKAIIPLACSPVFVVGLSVPKSEGEQHIKHWR
ncbi:hypothetical protein VHEMI03233 [[Torrubiella] hemipterigena]|uniref:Uncharacterized protein n=1 Tax=[Torrubiella] hemipterigena TaxID=1531966 RepID=A0A0A1SS23_9HYPO|nr:hypothetical protein VHEMI03233 [[Torrubiella] hemipterigena]